jgi:hopanoid biosynthesis associated protein HpnK
LRRLIVNADDFGLTSGINRGIIEAHQNGLVTSTTLMASGQKFSDAAELVRPISKLGVGCHVVLVDGWPCNDPKQVPSLMSPKSPGRFRDSLASFAVRAAARQLDSEQIEAEVVAQIQKLESSGITVSHLDSHKHTHMFPVVLKGVLRAAKRCGVRAMRNPFEPLVFASTRHWKRQFQLRMLSRFRPSFRKALDDAGVVTPDGCIGIAATGGLTAEMFRSLIEHLPEGTWEFVSHPGYNDAELEAISTRLRESREKELAILTSVEAKQVLQSEGIELISFRDLQA